MGSSDKNIAELLDSYSPVESTFEKNIAGLLKTYKGKRPDGPLPKFEGEENSTIFTSLRAMGERMWAAEEASTRAAEEADLWRSQVARVCNAVSRGDLSQRIVAPSSGVSKAGTDGITGEQAAEKGAEGSWKELATAVNTLATNYTLQVQSISQVASAVTRGDFSSRIEFDAKGDLLELKNTINAMLDQLTAVTTEVKQVARMVGTEGRLGMQAEVGDAEGVWRDIIMALNSMASNLTSQVRGFAQISAAAMDGEFARFITVEASGEIDSLKTQINQMVLNLRDNIQKNNDAREAAEADVENLTARIAELQSK